MKSLFKVLFILCIITSLISCEKIASGKKKLEGTWLLTEILVDPGDLSGTFQPVNSSKILQFHPDGTVTSNGEICSISIEAYAPSAATYSAKGDVIQSAGCREISFERNRKTLTLHYPQCIEPCAARFVKQDD